MYPEGLRRAICRGLFKKTELEKDNLRQILLLCTVDSVGEVPESEEDSHDWIQAWDDVSGKELDPKEVRAVRRLEMDHVDLKKVWHKSPRSEAGDPRWISNRRHPSG